MKEKRKTENIILQHGDCLELMNSIPDGSADLILCDLPFGITRADWDVPLDLNLLWEQYKRIIKTNGAICLFAAEPFASRLRLSNLKMYKYDWVWDKVKSTGFLNAKKQPLRCHEFICVFYKKQCKYNPQKTQGHVKKSAKRKSTGTNLYNPGNKEAVYESTERYPRSIQVFSSDVQKSALHPTQKPVALLEYLIRTYTDEGELVLDNCMGSGSTGVACIHTGRRFIGMEKDKEFFETAKKRLEEELRTGVASKNASTNSAIE